MDTPNATAVNTRAERMEIHVIDEDMDSDLDESARWLQAQFNPTDLKETVKAIWAELAPVGLSHQRQQYVSTSSIPYKFDLYFDALAFENLSDGAGILEEAQKFLRSLAFPTERTGAPPRCLFYWPQFISLTCRVDEIGFNFSQFASSGANLEFTATVTLKEIRDVRLLRGDIYKQGNRRSDPPAGKA